MSGSDDWSSWSETWYVREDGPPGLVHSCEGIYTTQWSYWGNEGYQSFCYGGAFHVFEEAYSTWSSSCSGEICKSYYEPVVPCSCANNAGCTTCSSYEEDASDSQSAWVTYYYTDEANIAISFYASLNNGELLTTINCWSEERLDSYTASQTLDTVTGMTWGTHESLYLHES